MASRTRFRCMINGQPIDIDANAELLLIDLLREELRLTGTKRGCGIGSCGSCTVLIDGKVRKACRVQLKDLGTRNSELGTRHSVRKEMSESRITSHESRVPEITTIEGLSHGNTLHPIQQAFIDCGAIQCGFCTPGMVLAAKALLDARPNPTREEIRRALAGNLCRCTGYQQIFEAIEEAARRMRKIAHGTVTA